MWFKRGITKKSDIGFNGLRRFFKFQGYNNIEKRVVLALIILVVALVVFSSYFLYFYISPVSSGQEFINAMADCKRVSWVREDIQANWIYTILGNAKGDACNVEVQLLKIKEGTIDNEKLQGKKMTCIILKNEIKLPEKDLFQCSGILKEELQVLIIEKMHDYLLKNLIEANEGLEGI